jgi:hypothetical protein
MRLMRIERFPPTGGIREGGEVRPAVVEYGLIVPAVIR